MKRSALLFLSCSVLAGVSLYVTSTTPAAAQEAAAKPKPLKALLIAGGCCHDYKAQKDILKAGLEARLNLEIEISYNPDSGVEPTFPQYEKDGWAKGFDLIIHDECAAGVKDLTYVNRVLQAHRDGVPGVNLHCAMHSYRTAPDVGKPVKPNTNDSLWFDYLGLQSAVHGAQLPIAITYLDKASPITKNLPEWTTVNEELYNNVQVYPGAHPLARGKQGGGEKDGENNSVAVWTNEYGDKKTRIFSTTLGHNNETVADDRYLDLVAQGILWATDKLNADGSAKAGYGLAKKK